MKININIFYKLTLFFLVVVARHARVPKITTLEYFCKILGKKRAMMLVVCMQINIKVSYKLVLKFLMSVARHVQSK